MGDTTCNNRGESHLCASANGRSRFGVNLPANFGLARFINIRSNSFTRPCHRDRVWARIPRMANIPFLKSLYSDEHSVRDRMVAARSGTVPVRLFDAKTIGICYDFLPARRVLDPSIHNSFLPEVRASYFVIMLVLAASALILIAKAELLCVPSLQVVAERWPLLTRSINSITLRLRAKKVFAQL